MSKPKIKINNIWSTIEDISEEAIVFLYNELAFDIPGAYFAKQKNPYLKNWDGKKRLSKKIKERNGLVFLTGLVARVITLLHERFNLICDLEDERKKPDKTLFYDWNELDFELRKYQIDVVKESLKKSRGTLEMATGSGKTVVASKIIQELGVSPFIFYVTTHELLYQAKERLEASIKNLEVGIIGNGLCEIKDINVMTIQTATTVYGKNILKDLKKFKPEDFDSDIISSWKKEDLSHIKKLDKAHKIKELIENCKGMYADEAHHVPSQTAHDIITKSTNCYHIFGGSATPYRTDNADLIIEGLFGRKICKITASALIKMGYLMKPEIYFIKLKNKHKSCINYQEDVKYNIIENEERNNHIKQISEFLRSQDLSVLILVRLIEHGKTLNKMIYGSEFIHGSISKNKRSQEIKDLNSGKNSILIGSVLADEGLDIPTLNCVILAGGGESPIKCKQRVGRAIRKSKGKSKSIIFDFMDVGKYTKKHSKARINILKDEEEFVVREIDSYPYKGDFELKRDFSANELF